MQRARSWRALRGKIRLYFYVALVALLSISPYVSPQTSHAAATGLVSPSANSGSFAFAAQGYTDATSPVVEASRNQIHEYRGYSFSIPENVVITGVEVNIDDLYAGLNDGVRTIAVEISGDGGSTFSSTGNVTPDVGTAINDYIFGNTSDTWGLPLTRDSFMSDNFVVRLSTNNFGSNSMRLFFDWLPVQVYYELAGSISGYKWEDLDGDGEWDDDESGLENVTILLGGDATGSAVTDSDGYYTFTGLLAGDYTVSEEVPTGYTQSAPIAGSHSVGLVSGSLDAEDVNFGNYPSGSLTVCKYDNLTDAPLNGWEIVVERQNGNTWEAQARGETETAGCVTFDELLAGEYRAFEIMQDGWRQVVPAEGDYLYTTVGQQTVEPLQFWNEEIVCPMPLDIMITIDISNSMGSCSDPFWTALGKVGCEQFSATWNDDLLDVAVARSKTFIDNLTSEDQVGLVVFADTSDSVTRIVKTLEPATSLWKDEVKTALDGLSSGYGGTDLGLGLEMANDQLIANGQLPGNAKILLFSDGTPTLPSAPSSSNNGTDEPNVVDQYTRAADNEHHIYSFGMSSDVYSSLMQSMADATGGLYYPPTVSDSELFAIFSNNKYEQCEDYSEIPICGDGAIQLGEQCDDGNTDNGDGCSSQCLLEDDTPDPICGDGEVNQEAEQCDDGNVDDGDGCSAQCLVEETPQEPICGNEVIETGEQCDDGNIEDNDGCSAQCLLEEDDTPDPICGDGEVNQEAEQCDDGNVDDGDGCSAQCLLEEDEDDEDEDDSNDGGGSTGGGSTGGGSSGGSGSGSGSGSPNPVPSLKIKKTTSQAVFNPGGQAAFLLSVKNSGTGPAFGVSIEDTLPEGFFFEGTDSVSATWDIGVVSAGDTHEQSYIVDIDQTVVPGDYTNVAVVTSDGGSGVGHTDSTELTFTVIEPDVQGFTTEDTSTEDEPAAGGSGSDDAAAEAVDEPAPAGVPEAGESDDSNGEVAAASNESDDGVNPQVLGYEALPETGGPQAQANLWWIAGLLTMLLGAFVIRFASAKA